jgi:DNA-binding response OmpR family regulator
MAQILLIDDDDLLRNVIAKALKHAGHTVIQASDGQMGVEVSRVTDLDLVITDLVMPVQEGVETITVIHGEKPDLPIIAISGGLSNSDVYLQIAAKVGARRVLPKPFTPPELLAVIAEVLPPA